MDLKGRLLGNRYEIIEKIGSGGMATVYKAKCHVLNRYVAIKILIALVIICFLVGLFLFIKSFIIE